MTHEALFRPQHQARAALYTRLGLLVCTLALIFSSGCRETTDLTAAPAARPAPASAVSKTPAHGHADALLAQGEAEGVRLSPAAQANLGLQVAEATTQTIEQIVHLPGIVKAPPDRTAVVTARLAARIEKVYVNVGDYVKQGAALLDVRSTEAEKLQVELLRTRQSLSIVEQSYVRTKELTDKTILTELEQLQQELIKTYGTLQMTAAAVERVQQLSDQVVPRKELLTAQTEHQHARSAHDATRRKLQTYGVTEAQIRTMLHGGLTKPVLTNLGLSPQAAIQQYFVLGKPSELYSLEAEYRQKQAEAESLQRQLQLLGFSAASVKALLQRGVPDPILTLQAPLSGTVSRRQAIPGALVEAASTLLEIMDTAVVWVEGEVTEQLFPAVQAGQTARVRVAAYPDEVFTGTVRTLGRTVNPDKRTVHLWIEVANPQGHLLPEMFTEVSLVTRAVTEVLAVPVAALLTEGAEQFVFVESGDLYVRQHLVLGLRDDRYVEVRDGLFPGDRVVVRGGHALNAARLAGSQRGVGGHDHSTHSH
ncbi:MAG: efflux RND transporter periplasmic adaptor subunit [Candidatus Tectimicrobiota bacterium]